MAFGDGKRGLWRGTTPKEKSPTIFYMFDFEFILWLGAKNAGAYCDRSADWVGIYATPWVDKPVKGRIRFKYEGRDRRFYRLDLDAMLTASPKVRPTRNALGQLVGN